MILLGPEAWSLAGVDRDADHSHEIGGIAADVVVERKPMALGGFPTEGTSDIRAGIKQVGLAGMIEEAADKPAMDRDVAPVVRCGGQPRREQGQDGDKHCAIPGMKESGRTHEIGEDQTYPDKNIAKGDLTIHHI
jgi:hypothetical protein